MAPGTSASSKANKLPPKKSLRIWVRNNGHVLRSKKKKFSYVYPRTVEAAKDPFVCATGKNKMFYLIAINLFPDSKIIKPDESESDTDVEETVHQSNSSDQESQTKTERQQLIKKRVKKASSKPLPSAPDALKPHNSGKEYNESSCDVSTSTSTSVTQETEPRSNLTKTKTSHPPPFNRKGRPLKKTVGTGGVENKKECSKFKSLSKKSYINKSNKVKVDDVVKLTAAAKAPPRKTAPAAIPSIISSLHKVIQNCSETGTVSFCLPKKTPRESRS